MLKVAIVLGSTRPGRKSPDVGTWALELASKRTDATFEIVDLADVNLPLLDEAIPPSMGKYEHEHTKKWAAQVAGFDAFVFVTPEYNHATSAVLKNALDFVYAEWNDKAAGFIGYGSAGGTRAVESLRPILSELQIAHVRAQVALSLSTDFENYKTFKPDPKHEKTLATMLDQVVAWGGALKTLRDAKKK
ncbi:NADPH-dependent oxidoreductase [bacterium]|nr:MAG: NADPH-dependent oxidoreductase [bacterium]